MLEHYRSQVTADSLRVNSVLFDITTAQYTSTESLTNTQECMLLLGNRRPDEEALAALDRLDNNLALFRQNTAAVSSITIYTNNPGIPDRNHITYVPEIAKENGITIWEMSGVPGPVSPQRTLWAIPTPNWLW